MAQRIQLKRSSILGKRPDSQYLEPGEVALNTNSSDPGAFFETNDGNVAKVGPTYIGTLPPPSDIPYGEGENWYDEGNATFNTYSTAAQRWLPTLSPLFGGAPTAIFVGGEFPEASDDLSNDGSARPFATINRAAIEVARRSILQNRADAVFNGKFAIILLPGENTCVNEPGLTKAEFEAESPTFVADQPLPQDLLRKFNSELGGVILPRGCSIFGFDLRKTVLRPTYYPMWTRLGYETNPDSIAARTSILKWTGNSYLFQMTFKDKKGEVSVKDISTATALAGGQELGTEVAVLTSLEPHGYRTLVTDTEGTVITADTVTLTYPDAVSRTYEGEPTVAAGEYYAEPIDTNTFKLRVIATGQELLRNELPEEPAAATLPAEFLNLSYKNTTHHRMSATMFATNDELNDYYFKVQTAFSNIDFGGTVNNAEVAPGETQIVAPTPTNPTNSTDTVKNSSPYMFNASVRSSFGLSGADVDGQAVTGFKSSLFSNFTTVSINNDPEVYEVYYNDAWVSLRAAYANAFSVPETDVTDAKAMEYLITSVQLENIRFFYRARRDIGASITKNSSGLPDQRSDTRHWCVKVSNDGYAQVVGSFAVGPAVNYWTQYGGRMTLANANSNFGGQALRSEGFNGIGTTGGSLLPDRNFRTEGIRRPLNVTKAQLRDTGNHKQFAINSEIASTTATTLNLVADFDPTVLLPYTLRPGTKIYVNRVSDGVQFSATLAANPFDINFPRTINVESSGNTINDVAVADMGVPYVRRFVDPRTQEQKSYSIWMSNTSATHRPPASGRILRYAEVPDPASVNLLVPGAQLDPGVSGGWNHVFQVHSALSKEEGDNPNADLPGDNAAPGTQYYVSLMLCDNAGPWLGDETAALEPDMREYQRGQLVTYNERVFVATSNEVETGADAGPPTSRATSWEPIKPFEVCEPFEIAYVNDNYPATEDPLDGSYAATDTYARGVQPLSALYPLVSPTDFDNGTETLGLEGTGNYANFGDPARFDPIWSTTKRAMYRFLELLGYTNAQIGELLLPQRLSARNIAVETFPSITAGEGYALTTGKWPLEFNVQSTINCSAHTWEWAGYFTYSKGLPEYQNTSLSNEQRLSYLATSVWGGDTTAYGSTELGEFLFDGLNLKELSGDNINQTNINFDFIGQFIFDRNLIPTADNEFDIGSPTRRVRNIYTGDLHLKNDRGDWTMIEEKEYLSLRNNETGKTFRLDMTLVPEEEG